MFREIRNTEVQQLERLRKEEEERRIARNGYLKIKPQTDITVEEAMNFMDNLFMMESTNI